MVENYDSKVDLISAQNPVKPGFGFLAKSTAMASNEDVKVKYKLIPDWNLPAGKSQKKGLEIRIHPYALISYTQKKWGIGKASQLAISLLNKKYNRLFEAAKVYY